MARKPHVPTGRRDGNPGKGCQLFMSTPKVSIHQGCDTVTQALNRFRKFVEDSRKIDAAATPRGQVVLCADADEAVKRDTDWFLSVNERGTILKTRELI